MSFFLQKSLPYVEPSRAADLAGWWLAYHSSKYVAIPTIEEILQSSTNLIENNPKSLAISKIMVQVVSKISLKAFYDTLWPNGEHLNDAYESDRQYLFAIVAYQYQTFVWSQGTYLLNETLLLPQDTKWMLEIGAFLKKQSNNKEQYQPLNWNKAIDIWTNRIRKDTLAITSRERDAKTIDQDCEQFVNLMIIEESQRENMANFLAQAMKGNILTLESLSSAKISVEFTPIMRLYAHVWSLFLATININDPDNNLSILFAINSEEDPTNKDFEEILTDLIANVDVWRFAQTIHKLMKFCFTILPNLPNIIFDSLEMRQYILTFSIVSAEMSALKSFEDAINIVPIVMKLNPNRLKNIQLAITLVSAGFKSPTKLSFPDPEKFEFLLEELPDIFLNFTPSRTFSVENLSSTRFYFPNLQLQTSLEVKNWETLLPIDMENSASNLSSIDSNLNELLIEVLYFFIFKSTPLAADLAKEIAKAWLATAIVESLLFDDIIEIITKVELFSLQFLCCLMYAILFKIGLETLQKALWSNKKNKSEQEFKIDVQRETFFACLILQYQASLWSQGFYLHNHILQEKSWQNRIWNLILERKITRRRVLSVKQDFAFTINNKANNYNLVVLDIWGEGEWNADLLKTSIIPPYTDKKFILKKLSPDKKTGIRFRITDAKDQELGFASVSFFFDDTDKDWLRVEGSKSKVFTDGLVKVDIYPVKILYRQYADNKWFEFMVGESNDVSPSCSETNFDNTLGAVVLQNVSNWKLILGYYRSTDAEDWYWIPNVLLDSPPRNCRRTLFFRGTGFGALYLSALSQNYYDHQGFVAITFRCSKVLSASAAGTSQGSTKNGIETLDSGLNKYKSVIPNIFCFDIGQKNQGTWSSPYDSPIARKYIGFEDVKAIISVVNRLDYQLIVDSCSNQNKLAKNQNWYIDPMLDTPTPIFPTKKRVFLLKNNDLAQISLSTINTLFYTMKFNLNFISPSWWPNSAEGSEMSGLQVYKRRGTPAKFEYKIGEFNMASLDDPDKPESMLDKLDLEMTQIAAQFPEGLIFKSMKNELLSIVQTGRDRESFVTDAFNTAVTSAKNSIDILAFSHIDTSFLKLLVEALNKIPKNQKFKLRIFIAVALGSDLIQAKTIDPQNLILDFQTESDKLLKKSQDCIEKQGLDAVETLYKNGIQSAINHNPVLEVALGAGRAPILLNSRIPGQPNAITGWNHQKILVVDGGKMVLAGGMNFMTEFLDAAKVPTLDSYDTVNDVSLLIEGEAALGAQKHIDYFWGSLYGASNRTNKQTGIYDMNQQMECKLYEVPQGDQKFYYLISTTKQNKNQIDFFRNFANPSQITATKILPIWTVSRRTGIPINNEPSDQILIKLIDIAQTELNISQQAISYPTPWSLKDGKQWPEIINALRNALRRGVTIKILLCRINDKNPSDDGGYTSASATDVKDMITLDKVIINKGNQHLLSVRNLKDIDNKTPARNHGKVIISDEKFAYVGSQNLYPTSAPLGKGSFNIQSYFTGESPLGEFGFMILHPDTAKKIKTEYFDPLWNYSL